MKKKSNPFGYSDKLLQHFHHPKNIGEMESPDGIGKVGNPICGDVMYLFIRVGRKGTKEFIKDIKVRTMGCVAAIATSSMITELAKGKTLEEAEKITSGNVASALEGLPPAKHHCSNLAAQALHAAIEDYKRKKRR